MTSTPMPRVCAILFLCISVAAAAPAAAQQAEGNLRCQGGPFPPNAQDLDVLPHSLPKPAGDVVVRRDQATLSDAEKQTLKSAFITLWTRAESDSLTPFEELVQIHENIGHRQHLLSFFVGVQSGCPITQLPTGAERFLAWHRAYLYALESELRIAANDPRLTLPYWDWTKDRSIPDWLDFFPPEMRGANGESYTVTRDPGGTKVRIPELPPEVPEAVRSPLSAAWNRVVPPHELPSPQEVHSILRESDAYTVFTRRLEDFPHNAVHTWVGGTMSNPYRSPADPVFWLHHANIDRLWAVWQGQNPGAQPILPGEDDVMQPWRYSYHDLAQTRQLEYRYDREQLEPLPWDHPLTADPASAHPLGDPPGANHAMGTGGGPFGAPGGGTIRMACRPEGLGDPAVR